MMDVRELLERLEVGEGQDIEFKAAAGGLPNDIWLTLSAFANTDGGWLLLGIDEQHGRFDLAGIRNPNAQLKAFWDNHNNRQKLSVPVCAPGDVALREVDGRKLLVVHVPRASRTMRPVYINGNPLLGSYKRNHEGDYHCNETEVRQMLRDASDEPQDAQIIHGFELGDLDPDSLKGFRQRFASREPDHPFLALDDRGLLTQLGGWRRDRNSDDEGLTLAGLLMLGRGQSLQDALPRHQLDYQEQLSEDPEVRWTFRLTADGRWEPNLFNFYYRVYPRLIDGLEVPFKLDKQAVRLGQTHVHEALREALVNALVHADHQSARPILLIKRTRDFAFQNPGRLRIPLEALYQGGISDPRNPWLQKMFQMLGLGEKAGSGFQKILRAWSEQHWLRPMVRDDAPLDMTIVRMPLVSMIPEEIEIALRKVVGTEYAQLDELDRLILILAHQYGDVGNTDVQPYADEHPRAIGERLKQLVQRDWLLTSNKGRWTRYRLAGTKEGDLFRGLSASGAQTTDPEHSSPSFQHYGSGFQHYDTESQHYGAEQWHDLEILAAPVREKGRVDKDLVEMTVLQLCSQTWLTLRELSRLLGRGSDTLSNHYLRRLVRDGRVLLKFPNSPNHPEQAYRTKSEQG